MYIGEWKNDKQHGKGKMINKNGDERYGRWEVGRLVEELV